MAVVEKPAMAVPPGLEGDLEEYCHGGDEQWLSFGTKKSYTNALIIQQDKILLGLKKRGFGTDKYNGFGGKVEPGETSLEAAQRELKEEAGIEAPLEHCGTFIFYSEGAAFAHHIEYYRAETFSGQVSESEEMRPVWFSIHQSMPSGATSDGSNPKNELSPVPHDKMWEADRFWLPIVLQGQHFVGRADFGNEDGVYHLQRWWFGTKRRADSEL